jgi:hypothetical protein
MRGPLATPNPITGTVVPLRQQARGAALFAECLQAAVTRGLANCPRAFVGVDIGFEEIPGNLENWWSDRVPLAAAVSAQNGHNAQVVLFRRPLEHRAATRSELRRLVHRALVEQLSALTGISMEELDPGADPDDWE